MENVLRVLTLTYGKTSVEMRKELASHTYQIEQSPHRYNIWVKNNFLSVLVKNLKTTLEELKYQTLTPSAKKTDVSQKIIAEDILNRLIQNILKIPVIQLNTACIRRQANEWRESINILINV